MKEWKKGYYSRPLLFLELFIYKMKLFCIKMFVPELRKTCWYFKKANIISYMYLIRNVNGSLE